MIKDFVKIYQHGLTDPLTDETFIKAFVDSIFKNDLIVEYYTFMN